MLHCSICVIRSPGVAAGKSLREIQEEEAKRLEKEKREKQKKAAALQAATPLATASLWGAGKPASVTSGAGWANEGAWGAASAGTKKTSWEPVNSKPSNKSPSRLVLHVIVHCVVMLMVTVRVILVFTSVVALKF